VKERWGERGTEEWSDGAKLGAFSRNGRLTTEDFEMLIIVEK
jgi:hypothetical protein